jgi:hypothetical protein
MIEQLIFNRCIWISKDKEIRPILFFDKIEDKSILAILNEANQISMFYKQIIDIIEAISQIKDNVEIEYDTNMATFSIHKEKTIIKNYLFDEIPEVCIYTIELLNFFLEKKRFIESFNKESLYELIKEGLRSAKHEYFINETNNIEIHINDIYIIIGLSETEIKNLNIDNYVNELIFKYSYFQ